MVQEVLTEEVKLSLSQDNMIVYVENPNMWRGKEKKEKRGEEEGRGEEGKGRGLLLSKFIKFNIQNPTAFVYTSKK